MRLWPKRHRHEWAPVAATVHHVYNYRPSGARYDLPQTIETKVLRRCPCGDVSVKYLPGAWTLAEILGEGT